MEKKPRIFFLLDNSESMGISKGEYDGLNSYRATISQLGVQSFETADIDYFTLGAKTTQIADPDSISALESETNFINAINQLQELEDDYDAAVIISDGIITFGRNPSIQVAESTIPIYTISLGDSNSVKDVTINNVISNPTGYTDSRHVVEVELSQTGYPGETTTVSIYNQQNEILGEEEITFQAYEEVRSIEFQIPLDEAGLQQFNIYTEPLEEEWTEENNTNLFSIDVLDSKTNILHVAFEIHPDVKTVRSILQEDETVELTTLTWLNGTRFIETLSTDNIDFDLVIYHGHPNRILNVQLLQNLESLPAVYFQLPGSRRSQNPFLSNSLIRNTGTQVFPLMINPGVGNTDHPIMELPEINFNTIANISTSLRTVLFEADAIPLYTGNFQGMETPNPLIAVLERGNLRQVEVAAWGLYKLYQSPNEEEREYITQLISNMVIWASNDPDNRRLKVSPSKSLYNVSEEIIINANLNNESGEPESDASIDIVIESDASEQQSYNMQNLGSGAYKLELNSLSPGRYSYTASARKGNRQIDEQVGEFIIENSNSELINTIRNDALLANIANETVGRSYNFTAINSFWDDLREDNVLETKQELVEAYQFPVRSIFWFIVLLTLLASEWLIRKYYALP